MSRPGAYPAAAQLLKDKTMPIALTSDPNHSGGGCSICVYGLILLHTKILGTD